MEPRERTAVRIRTRTRSDSEAISHRVAVFTAIDGTLLDGRTFDGGPNRSCIRRLQATGVPVIPMSVLTLDEIAPIARDLGLQRTMVIEAGGAIARWTGGGWDVEAFGPPAETLLDVVREIEDRSGASLFLDVTRETPRFSERFVIESGDLEAIRRAAADLGFSVRRGRRFHHLCRACDEGEAFARIREELHCDVAIAVGGSLVDAAFMKRADVAVIVPGPDGVDSELLAIIPNARIAPSPAPDGWAVAVEEALRSVATSKRRARPAAS